MLLIVCHYCCSISLSSPSLSLPLPLSLSFPSFSLPSLSFPSPFHSPPSLSLPPKVSASGQVLQSEIIGAVKMNVKLTGMPELRLGLNDKILFQNTGRKSTTIYLYKGKNGG